MSKHARPLAVALALLVLAPCLASGQGGPFASGSLPCWRNETGAGLAGGYHYTDPKADSLLGLGETAFVQWFNQDNQNISCTPDNFLQPPDIQVLEACQQVVAGTNYALLLNTVVDCSFGNSTIADNVTLNAIVYQPLGLQGTPNVTFVEATAVSEEELEVENA